MLCTHFLKYQVYVTDTEDLIIMCIIIMPNSYRKYLRKFSVLSLGSEYPF